MHLHHSHLNPDSILFFIVSFILSFSYTNEIVFNLDKKDTPKY